MKTKVVKPVGKFLNLWDELARVAPNSCFWSTHTWVDAIADAYGWKPFLFVSEIKNSPIIIPSVRTKTTLVFGTYDSLPFGYGSVLSREPIGESVMNEIVESISKLPIASLIINLPPGHPIPKSTGFLKAYERYTHILTLDFGKEKLMSKLSKECRWSVRRALKEKVEIKKVDVSGGIKILKEIYKSWAKIKRPKNVYKDKLFENIMEFPSDVAHIYTAEHEGNKIACMLNFLWKNEIYNFMTVDVRKKGAEGAVNLLCYHALGDSLDSGITRFIFGESLGIKSLEKFKESFGAQKVPVYSVKVEGRGYKGYKRMKSALL